MFNFSEPTVEYKPFPIVIFRNFLRYDVYEQLVSSFPAIDNLGFKKDQGRKFTLSLKDDPAEFKAFLSQHPLWDRFAASVTSKDTTRELIVNLDKLGFDLGIETKESTGLIESFKSRVRNYLGTFSNLTRNRLVIGTRPVSSKFEFSALPANGGFLLPHTDAPEKLATFVLPMVAEGDWETDWGGGTDIYTTKKPELSFNRTNRQRNFSDVHILETYDFLPNQALLFVRTDTSWHGVSPIRGPEGIFRRSITWNLYCTKQVLYI